MDETPQIQQDQTPDPRLHSEEQPTPVPEAAQADVAPTGNGEAPPAVA